MPDKIRNTARQMKCRSSECKPSGDEMAAVSKHLGKAGKAQLPGHKHLVDLVGRMKESNVWKGSIKGYFFKGTVPTKMKSDIESYARTARWKVRPTPKTKKQGILWRERGKKYLLIFATYKGAGNRVYCSLTII
jgi:hypothetical protein